MTDAAKVKTLTNLKDKSMEEPLTISDKENLSKSQDYDFLREEALQYIQSISGKLWTDYNTHDPGITILEVLCYALTDMGYRSSFPIQDLLAPRPEENSLPPVFYSRPNTPRWPSQFSGLQKNHD